MSLKTNLQKADGYLSRFKSELLPHGSGNTMHEKAKHPTMIAFWLAAILLDRGSRRNLLDRGSRFWLARGWLCWLARSSQD